MDRERIIFKPDPWIKWAPLPVSWILSFLILTIVFSENDSNTLYNEAARHGPRLRPLKNEVRGLSYIRWDTQEDHRPIYSVCFDNLRVENNDLGIFKTALHKVAKIRGLKLELYRHNSPEAASTSTTDIYSVYGDLSTDAGVSVLVQIKELLPMLTAPRRGWRIGNIHLGNVSEVCVDDFDYRVLGDDDVYFGVQSSRAMVSYRWSDILLRGRVKIRIADGSTLESNYIKWDVKKRHFSVKGVYVLNRSGTVTTGKGICLDAQFNNVRPQNAKATKKENKECYARL